MNKYYNCIVIRKNINFHVYTHEYMITVNPNLNEQKQSKR